MGKATLTVGDWSGDGHEKTETYMVDVPDTLKNAPSVDFVGVTGKPTSWGDTGKAKLNLYYAIGLTGGVPDIGEFCAGYEENRLPIEEAKKLIELFGEDIFEDGFDEDDDDVYMNHEDYARIWVDIVNRGIKLNGEDAVVTLIPRERSENYNIGGYGLFY